MQSPSPLVLAHADRRWALGGRPISIGRLTECDVILPGDKVSRRHACCSLHARWALLVDSSRHGTLINGEQMQAPWLLADGDEVKVGGVDTSCIAGNDAGDRWPPARGSIDRDSASSRAGSADMVHRRCSAPWPP